MKIWSGDPILSDADGAERVGKTEGTAGLQQAAHRSTFLSFPEAVLAVALGHTRLAIQPILTLLASVGCASLAPSLEAGRWKNGSPPRYRLQNCHGRTRCPFS